MGINIVVDGTTGVGKTSLIKLLTEEFGYIAYNEIFRDENNLLERFFTEGNRWCFPMQISFLNHRYIQYKEASYLNNTIMDRSIYSDPIFAGMYLKEGNMSSEEHSVYTSLFNSLTSSLTPPELVIYLDVTAGEAIRRIRGRGREDELLMPEEYWLNLHEGYSNYYRNYSSSPLLKIDVTQLDYVNRENDRKYMTNLIGEFLASRQLKIG
jgi:deoxyadenosine/deoxycytidine kinase